MCSRWGFTKNIINIIWWRSWWTIRIFKWQNEFFLTWIYDCFRNYCTCQTVLTGSTQITQTQKPTQSNKLVSFCITCRSLDTKAKDSPSLSWTALLRQTPKVGAGCVSSARPDLCGGQEVTLVPTATKQNVYGCKSFTKMEDLIQRIRKLIWHYHEGRTVSTINFNYDAYATLL